jgi:thiamine monophosphate synthase
MAKVKISKWDAELRIPLDDKQEIGDLKLGDEVEMTVKGKVTALQLREPDSYDKKRGIDSSGTLTVMADSVQIGEEVTEFEVASMNYDGDCCCD